MRSATYYEGAGRYAYIVSIHALLAECDLCGGQSCAVGDSFNPRTPCGVRPVPASCPLSCLPFQSTHSLRSATGAVDVHSPDYYVSIHALLAECDVQLPEVVSKARVSIHALLAECDRCTRGCRPLYPCFNPRTPCGVRRGVLNCTVFAVPFQSTHSLRSATTMSNQIKLDASVSIHALLAECDA